MKNTAIIIFACLVTINCCFADKNDDKKEKSDREKKGLQGDVKSIRTTSYDVVEKLEKVSFLQ